MATRIKICGVTSPDDARLAAEAGADAIGLNFYAQSVRCVGLPLATRIVRALPPFVEPVGVFVHTDLPHADLGDTRLTALALGMRTIQLHSDLVKPPGEAVLRMLAEGLRWVAAAAVRDEDSLLAITALVAACPPDWRPSAVLVDAHVAGQYGGTGQIAPWQLLAGFDPGVPLILAGGLTPDNVAEAIRTVRPFAVDVASGVESGPGRKDPDKVRRFVAAVRSADV
jgi:phosphoribosylanthranilate isomerase